MLTLINSEVISENGIKQTIFEYKSNTTTIISFSSVDLGTKTKITMVPKLDKIVGLKDVGTFSPKDPLDFTKGTVVTLHQRYSHFYNVDDEIYLAKVGVEYSNLDYDNLIVLSDPYIVTEIISNSSFVIDKEYTPHTIPPATSAEIGYGPLSSYFIGDLNLTPGDVVVVNYPLKPEFNGNHIVESVLANEIVINEPYPVSFSNPEILGTTGELYTISLENNKRLFATLKFSEIDASNNKTNTSVDLYVSISRLLPEKIAIDSMVLAPSNGPINTKFNFNFKTDELSNSWLIEVKAPINTKYKYKLMGNLFNITN